jgi:hypothetical protein
VTQAVRITGYVPAPVLAPALYFTEVLSRQSTPVWQINRFVEALANFDLALPIAADKPNVLNKCSVKPAALRCLGLRLQELCA